MRFENQYLTYSEYINLGGTIEEMPFNLLEFECRQRINRRTQNRLVNIEEIPDEVKLCIFRMIGELDTYIKESQTTGNIASENIDGYSVTYSSQTKEAINYKAGKIEEIMENCLMNVIVNGVHILYLGVM